MRNHLEKFADSSEKYAFWNMFYTLFKRNPNI